MYLITDSELITAINDGLTVKQIAEKYNITPQAVYKHLNKADLRPIIEDLRIAEYINLAEQRKTAYNALTSLLQAENDYTRLQAVIYTLNRSDKLQEQVKTDQGEITISKLMKGEFRL